MPPVTAQNDTVHVVAPAVASYVRLHAADTALIAHLADTFNRLGTAICEHHARTSQASAAPRGVRAEEVTAAIEASLHGLENRLAERSVSTARDMVAETGLGVRDAVMQHVPGAIAASLAQNAKLEAVRDGVLGVRGELLGVRTDVNRVAGDAALAKRDAAHLRASADARVVAGANSSAKGRDAEEQLQAVLDRTLLEEDGWSVRAVSSVSHSCDLEVRRDKAPLVHVQAKYKASVNT
jgi:hypothetical protein